MTGWFRCSVGAVGSESDRSGDGAARVRAQRAVVSTPLPTGVEAQKDAAAAAAVALVADGMLVGLGTGSTAAWAVRRLGAPRARRPRRSAASPRPRPRGASPKRKASRSRALDDVDALDLAIDGTDEADQRPRPHQGRRRRAPAREGRRAHGAEVRRDRRRVASSSTRSAAFPLPVEVVPFARSAVAREIEGLRRARPRTGALPDGTPFVTDNGNQILDCRFGAHRRPRPDRGPPRRNPGRGRARALHRDGGDADPRRAGRRDSRDRGAPSQAAGQLDD